MSGIPSLYYPAMMNGRRATVTVTGHRRRSLARAGGRPAAGRGPGQARRPGSRSGPGVTVPVTLSDRAVQVTTLRLASYPPYSHDDHRHGH